MAKKKGSNTVSKYAARDSNPAASFDPKKSRVARIETAEQAFGGDEDEFHRNRDEVLFEMNGKESRGGMDELSSDEEIYDLNLANPSSDEEEEAYDEGEEDEEDEDDEDTELMDEYEPVVEEPKGRFAKTSNPAQDILSDDEVEPAADADSDSDEETWAANSYHASRRAPGEADSEDDEALDLEAEEARRLQKRQRGAMAGDDFGLGDGGEEAEGEIEKMREQSRKQGRLEEDALVPQDGTATAGFGTDEEAIAYLLRNQPETLALLDDFTATAERMTSVEKALATVRLGENGKEHPALAIMEMEHQALSTYLPTLAFYFSLLLAPTPSADLVARVLARLTSLRSALATMEDLDLTADSVDGSDSEDYGDDGEDSEDLLDELAELEEDESMLLASEVWDLGQGVQEEEEEEDDDEDDSIDEDDSRLEYQNGAEEEDYDSEDQEATEAMIAGLNEAELEELIADMAGDDDADELIARVRAIQSEKRGETTVVIPAGKSKKVMAAPAPVPKSKKGRSKAQRKRDAQVTSATVPKAPILNLGPALAPASTASRTAAAQESDYLDPTFLSMADLSDKASRKHTLRFHVSQVHQKTMKRENGVTASGDDDLPRRSKERSRREVLKRQEHGGQTGEELDGMEWSEMDKKRARGVGNENAASAEDPEDYYDLVKSEQSQTKKAKKAKYVDDRGAEKDALDEMTDASAAGPRGATRKILANKGLQPKRAKVNRNPRVKKRLRYDKAVKKVASMKSVYKGGMATLGHGEYAGEKSGIGSRTVKSVKLGGS